MLDQLMTQFNVLKALAIYDLQGQMKSYNYGFVWLLLEPLIYIAGFRLMKQFLGSLAPPSGMTPLMFYVLGVLPLYLSLEGIRSYNIVASPPAKLLAFPRVTPIDLALASAISSFAVYFVLFWVISVPLAIYEKAWPPDNILPVMFGLISAWMLGISFGFIISGAARVFPPTKQFVSYTGFGLRVSSGMFFCITMIPIAWWPYLSWNPLLQATEMARDGWFEGYVSPIASPLFICECILAMMLLGLLIERFMRRIPYV
jgi:capsular polysaccharide transport system permease protein